MSPLEENILDLQKDLIIYILFSDNVYKSEYSVMSWYASEFIHVLKNEGNVNEQACQYIKDFLKNAETLLENEIIYDNERVRQELVTAFSGSACTQAIISIGEQFSDANRDRAKSIFSDIILNCMEKSKNSEEAQRLVVAQKAGLIKR